MTPAEAFFHHATEIPEDPWLFFQPELDWRWRSFRHLAVQVAGVARRLAESLPGGPRTVAFPEARSPEAAPDAVAMDLAVQAVGGTPVCVAAQPGEAAWEEALTAAGCDAQLLPRELLERAIPGLPAVEMIAPPSMFSAAQPPEISLTPCPVAEPWVRIAGEVFAPLPAAHRRDVVVLAGGFRAPAARTLLTWATLSGAALLLEPDARLGPAAVRWARPTVVLAGAGELEQLRREARPPNRWQQRRGCPFAAPLDRLRGLVLHGGEALPEGAVNFWRRAGVALLRLV